MDKTDTGLYFHIPFCRSKCPYCDFHSAVSKSCSDEYINAVIDEVNTLRRISEFVPDIGCIDADTVYFGGGTPSLMTGAQLERILEAVRKKFNLKDDSEITVECNPTSDNLRDFLFAAACCGVNRVSLGMQSADDSERKKLGRRGNSQDVKNAVGFAKEAGINNISLDVMIGVPESNLNTLLDTLDFALRLDVTHISAYILKIEEGTYYHKNINKLHIPDEDEAADMYLFMSEHLKKNGFFHYEISNFCKEGFYSRHNMKYWEGKPYLGFGPAAHSFYNGKRFYFPRDTEYFLNGGKAEADGNGGDEEEKILLSLRTYKGISLSDKGIRFKEKAGFFEKHGFAVINGDNFSLTAEGFLLSNTIISELLSVY